MKKNDWMLVAAAAAFAVIFFLIRTVLSGFSEPAFVSVYSDGELYGSYSLDEDRQISVNNTNILVIKDGAAWMEWADCPDQICVSHRKIQKDGESIICLPNKIVISVENAADRELDGMSR